MARAATTTKEKTAPAEMADASNAGKEMTVANGAPPARAAGPKTVQQERKEKIEKVVTELAKRAEDYRPFLAIHGIEFPVFTSIIKQALIKNNDLLDCSTATILSACMFCAKDGLMPDGRDAAIVPFKTTATYMPMYQGLLKIAYGLKDGNGTLVYRDVNLEVIYADEIDRFEYVAGTEPKVAFRPSLDRNPDQPIAGAFCVITTNNGGQFIEVVGAKELGKIAAVGKAGGPRKAWPGEFAKKDVLRRILKRTPKDDRLRQVLRHDEENYLPDGRDEPEPNPIPDDKLFDDTAHQVEEQRQDDQTRDNALAHARADLMEAGDAGQLDAVIAEIKKATGVFSADDIAGLLANAEQLRASRFAEPAPEEEGQPFQPGDRVELVMEGGEVVGVKVTRPDDSVAFHDAVQDADFVQAGHEDAGAEIAAGVEALEAHVKGPQPDAPAAAEPKASSTSATTATSRAAASAEPTAPAGTAPTASRSEWQQAPAERRITPGAILLAEPEEGVHYKAGIGPNANGQVPIFNRLDEIVCWAKNDMDIPTIAGPFPVAEAAAQPDPKTEPKRQPDVSTKPPETNTSAEPVQEMHKLDAAPQIRANPEDRQDNGGYEADDGYGETPVYRLKAHPAKPPNEYADAVEWRDAIIFKMSALKEPAIFKWWEDNRAFVEAAIPTAKAAAGRVLAQAAVRKLPGAKELVSQIEAAQ